MRTICALPTKHKKVTLTYPGRLTFVFFAACLLIVPVSAPIAHSAQVTLAWDANTEADLAGYKVYSKTGSAPSQDLYDRIIIICNDGAEWPLPCDAVLSTPGSPEHAVPNASDSEPTFFAVSAFDASGNESGLSSGVSYNPPAGDVNSPPVLDPIGAQTVNEGETLAITLTAIDPDGNSLSYSASSLPTGATFDPASQTFSWTVDYGDSGNYTVTFRVTDNGTPPLSDQETVTISAGDVNRPPVLDPIGAQTVNEGETLAITLTAIDPDGNSLSYSASSLPTGATFDPASQTFSWTVDYGDSGNYTVTFRVTDNGTPPLSDQETVTISAGDVNVPPLPPKGLQIISN